MGINTSRILIETIVKKTIREIRDSPERSIRNLVDIALHFSGGRFQHHFLQAAQAMLENERSPYYSLIQDLVAHLDSERILLFGMNLGYNSCTRGAQKIREIEERDGFHIPWMLSLQADSRSAPYSSVIDQGEELGVYAWMLFSNGQPQDALPLVSCHQDSAFFLFCSPRDITTAFLDSASELNNLMIAVRYDEDASDACSLMREAGLLYSVYYVYTAQDTETITGGELFCAAQQLHPVFTALLADRDCPIINREEIYAYVKQARNQQLFQTIPWEISYDSSYISGVISNDAHTAGFDEQGNLYTLCGCKPQEQFNLYQDSLRCILERAFPKA